MRSGMVLRCGEWVNVMDVMDDFLEILSENKSMDGNKFMNNFLDKLELSEDLTDNIMEITPYIDGINKELIKNSNIQIEINDEILNILSFSIISIILRNSYEDIIEKEEIRNLLEELKLRGLGNGIVKDLVSSYTIIGEVIEKLYGGKGFVKSFIKGEGSKGVLESILGLVKKRGIGIDGFLEISNQLKSGISNFRGDFRDYIDRLSKKNSKTKVIKITDIRDGDFVDTAGDLVVDSKKQKRRV